MIKLVAFDWNGTLFADTKAIVDADNVVLKKLGLPSITVKHFRNVFAIPLIEYYAACGIDREYFLKNQETITKLFHGEYEERVKHVRTRSGTRIILDRLMRQNIPAIIFSNHTHDGIHFQLRRLKMAGYFKEILARTLLSGPVENRIKGAKLEEYVENNNYKKLEVLIVADGVEEIEIGKTLGIPCAAISRGFTSTVRLKGAQPDYLIHNLVELDGIINILNVA